jgi:hypothetical protein
MEHRLPLPRRARERYVPGRVTRGSRREAVRVIGSARTYPSGCAARSTLTLGATRLDLSHFVGEV